jgi:uncharacterized protein involved in type VI secretion and phage assembly
MPRAITRTRRFVALLAGGLTLAAVGLAFEGSQDVAVPAPSPDRDIAAAIVVDNVDPSQTGRVRVRIPTLPREPSVWARLIIPTGKQSGFLFVPDVGDEVLVSFEHGDVNRPYVLGAIWNGKF